MDGVETVAQKLKEEATIPFSWKSVGTYFFNKGKLAAIGYSNEKIIKIIADLEIANVPLQEEQTLQEITALATDSLHKYSLVVVSHSQGGLFANLMYQRLNSDPSVANRMNRYANLQVGTAAAYISAPINDYYTNSSDVIINSLRTNFDVLPSNTNIIPLDSLSLLDFTQHGFVEIYSNLGTQA